MKIKNFIAIAIAVAAIVFIIVQFKKNNNQKPFVLTGDWQVDSIYSIRVPKDTSKFAISTLLDVNSPKPVFTVYADSTVIVDGKLTDTAFERCYLKDSTLYINRGKKFMPFRVLQKEETRFSFLTEDSIVVSLKRK